MPPPSTGLVFGSIQLWVSLFAMLVYMLFHVHMFVDITHNRNIHKSWWPKHFISDLDPTDNVIISECKQYKFVMPNDVYVFGLILNVSISLLTTRKDSPCVHSSLYKKKSHMWNKFWKSWDLESHGILKVIRLQFIAEEAKLVFRYQQACQQMKWMIFLV